MMLPRTAHKKQPAWGEPRHGAAQEGGGGRPLRGSAVPEETARKQARSYSKNRADAKCVAHPPDMVGPYEIGKPLGSGVFKSAFEAFDHHRRLDDPCLSRLPTAQRHPERNQRGVAADRQA